MNSRNKKSKKTFIIPLLAVILVAAGLAGYLGFAKSTEIWPFVTSSSPSKDASSSDSKSGDTQSSDGANTGDDSNDSNKNETDPNSEVKTDPATGKKTVNVSIAFADLNDDDNFEVRAYVDDIIEGTGTCTATLTMSNGTKVTGTSDAFINATSTQCRPIEIDKSKIVSGKWSVYVDYSSPTSAGKSPALEGTV